MRAISREVSLWELAVLALLREEPMHPYQMQRLLRERREDVVLGLKRGSLYHAINRLARGGLIQPVTVDREGRRPERTTYRATAAGRAALVQWLRHRLATPPREPAEFTGTISFLIHLPPDEVLGLLQARARSLQAQSEAVRASVEEARPRVARVHLIEKEYLLAMHEAEVAWLEKLMRALRAGQLTWNLKEILDGVRSARKTTTRRKEQTT